MNNGKRIVITGATGQLGSALSRHLADRGYQVVVFSRDPIAARDKLPGMAEYVAWLPHEHGDWAAAIDGTYAVVSAAGAPTIGQKWTREARQEMIDSRRLGTRGLVNAIAQAAFKPQALVYISGVSAYGFTTCSSDVVDEATQPDHDDYAEEIALIEQETFRAAEYGVRPIAVRTGYVLDRNGGGLPWMAEEMRQGRQGIILPGTQYLPWIHIADEVGIIQTTIENPAVRGPINGTAPDVKSNHEFMETLAQVMGRSLGQPVPGAVLEQYMGRGAAILLRGRRVIPRQMLQHGYVFQFPTLESALRDLVSE